MRGRWDEELYLFINSSTKYVIISTDNRNAPYVVVNCNTSGADVIDTATGEKKFHFGEGLMFTTTVIDPTFR